ncbi:MAG: ZIP family metal transporter [archaeon]
MEIIFLVAVLAILGPVIGSLIGIITKPSNRFMFNMLSFAAGVMLSISFIELIPVSIKLSSPLISMTGIFLGAIVMFAIDRSIPHLHHGLCEPEQGLKLKKTSIYLLLGIAMHNFPEGMAMGIGSTIGVGSGLVIALAIAIHDIPEGICTSAPYYLYSKKKLKSFLLSSATAIPTLLGFLLAYFLLRNISPLFIGLITAATAGLMIYISADELIPASCSKTTNHSTIFSLMVGVILTILLVSMK